MKIGMGRVMVCGGVETINFMIQTDKKENEVLGHFHAIKKQYFVYITLQKNGTNSVTAYTHTSLLNYCIVIFTCQIRCSEDQQTLVFGS